MSIRLAGRRPWGTPGDVLANKDEFLQMAEWIDRRHIATALMSGLCSALAPDSGMLGLDELEELVSAGHVSKAISDIAALAGTPDERENAETPVVVNQPVLRVVSRYRGDMSDSRNQRTDGRLGAARLIGFGPANAEAHLMLLEIGRSICNTTDPACNLCVLAPGCRFARDREDDHTNPGLDFEISG